MTQVVTSGRHTVGETGGLGERVGLVCLISADRIARAVSGSPRHPRRRLLLSLGHTQSTLPGRI